MAGKKGLEVDRRVGIALGALAPGQRLVVGHVLQSPQSFKTYVDHHREVKLIKDGDPQLHFLRVTPKIGLVYERSAEGFRVVDLVERATVDRFTSKKAKKKTPKGGLKGQSGAPKAPTGKVGELV